LTIFWTENLVFITYFILYLSFYKAPLIYFKNLIHILSFAKNPKDTTAWIYLFFWLICGFPLLVFYLILDIVNLLTLLLITKSSVVEEMGSEQSEVSDKVQIYNEVLTIFIAIDELFKA
jgi:type III secretory pathway component EscV